MFLPLAREPFSYFFNLEKTEDSPSSVVSDTMKFLFHVVGPSGCDRGFRAACLHSAGILFHRSLPLTPGHPVGDHPSVILSLPWTHPSLTIRIIPLKSIYDHGLFRLSAPSQTLLGFQSHYPPQQRSSPPNSSLQISTTKNRMRMNKPHAHPGCSHSSQSPKRNPSSPPRQPRQPQ